MDLSRKNEICDHLKLLEESFQWFVDNLDENGFENFLWSSLTTGCKVFEGTLRVRKILNSYTDLSYED